MKNHNAITHVPTMLSPYLYVRKVHPASVYDFTFENRYVVHHYVRALGHRSEYVYSVVDTQTHRTVSLFSRSSLVSSDHYASLVPVLLFSIENSGKRRTA